MKYNREDNPYTLQFSYIPPQFISRKSMTDEILNDLKKKVPAFRGHFLTGVRGSGKTVMMADIANKMRELKDWVVVDIENPEGDICDSLARGLYRIPALKAMFIEAKLDISILGLGISIEKAAAIASNANDALAYMLEVLKKHNKRLLVTIDEVTYSREISAFSHSLSSYARSGFDVYVVMTGLKDNVLSIKNEKSLTFLYRAKEHELEPLNMTAVISDYEKVFDIQHDQAEKMGLMTKGYSFAFQTLGYIYWEALSDNEGDIEKLNLQELYTEYDQYLAEFVYDKLWSELPPAEKKVLIAMAQTDDIVKHVREKINMNSEKFSVYRQRLMEKGLIDGKEYGKVKFILPRFDKYALLQSKQNN